MSNSQALFEQLTLIKRDVDSRITYNNSGTINQLPDYTWVTPGSHGAGDCTVFAKAYEEACLTAGLSPLRGLSRVWSNGEAVAHAWVQVEDFALDCRFPMRVINVDEGEYYGMEGPM